MFQCARAKLEQFDFVFDCCNRCEEYSCNNNSNNNFSGLKLAQPMSLRRSSYHNWFISERCNVNLQNSVVAAVASSPAPVAGPLLSLFLVIK